MHGVKQLTQTAQISLDISGSFYWVAARIKASHDSHGIILGDLGFTIVSWEGTSKYVDGLTMTLDSRSILPCFQQSYIDVYCKASCHAQSPRKQSPPNNPSSAAAGVVGAGTRACGEMLSLEQNCFLLDIQHGSKYVQTSWLACSLISSISLRLQPERFIVRLHVKSMTFERRASLCYAMLWYSIP